MATTHTQASRPIAKGDKQSFTAKNARRSRLSTRFVCRLQFTIYMLADSYNYLPTVHWSLRQIRMVCLQMSFLVSLEWNLSILCVTQILDSLPVAMIWLYTLFGKNVLAWCLHSTCKLSFMLLQRPLHNSWHLKPRSCSNHLDIPVSLTESQRNQRLSSLHNTLPNRWGHESARVRWG